MLEWGYVGIIMRVTFTLPSWRVALYVSLPVVGVAVGLMVVHGMIVASRHIPDEVTQAAPFHIYVPTQLPKGFKVNRSSYHYVSGEGTLVFELVNDAGDRVAFTEQGKPANADFKQIDREQMVDPKQLANVPYPSTVGKTLDQKTNVLSVLAGNTWVMATTTSDIDHESLRQVALGLKPY